MLFLEISTNVSTMTDTIIPIIMAVETIENVSLSSLLFAVFFEMSSGIPLETNVIKTIHIDNAI